MKKLRTSIPHLTAIEILNHADKDGRSYNFVRTPHRGYAQVVLDIPKGDWAGPTPEITLSSDGTWHCNTDLYFGD